MSVINYADPKYRWHTTGGKEKADHTKKYKTVYELRSKGLSLRRIAALTGINYGSIQYALRLQKKAAS
jgi:hypothetical protein